MCHLAWWWNLVFCKIASTPFPLGGPSSAVAPQNSLPNLSDADLVSSYISIWLAAYFIWPLLLNLTSPTMLCGLGSLMCLLLVLISWLLSMFSVIWQAWSFWFLILFLTLVTIRLLVPFLILLHFPLVLNILISIIISFAIMVLNNRKCRTGVLRG